MTSAPLADQPRFDLGSIASFDFVETSTHRRTAQGAHTGTDCRATPEQRATAAAVGEALDNQRTLCMRRFGEGMTKIWNRLLDEGETDPEILQLRTLRDTMDRAVLAAYGWSDVDPTDTPTIVTRLRALNAARAAEEKRRG